MAKAGHTEPTRAWPAGVENPMTRNDPQSLDRGVPFESGELPSYNYIHNGKGYALVVGAGCYVPIGREGG